MTAKHPLPTHVWQVARRDLHVLTRSELLAGGTSRNVIRRRLATGEWQLLLDGCYALTTLPPTWPQRALAGLKSGGAGAALYGLSAAYVHGLVGSELVPIHVIVPSGQRPRLPVETYVVHRDGIGRQRRYTEVGRYRPSPGATMGSAPVRRLRATGFADTVVDACAQLDDEEDVIALLARANQRKDLARTALPWVLDNRRAVRHRRLITAFVTEGRGIHSILEYHYADGVARAHGLPEAIRQFSPEPGTYHDIGYPQFRLIVELDGRASHESWQAASRDRRRDAQSALAGFITLRFTWHQVTREPCATARTVAQALRMRGWQGTPHACRHCRATPTSGATPTRRSPAASTSRRAPRG